MQLRVSNWAILGITALTVSLSAAACGSDSSSSNTDAGTGGSGGSGGTDSGSGGSGAKDSGGVVVDPGLPKEVYRAGVVNGCMTSDAGTPTQAQCDAVGDCAVAACKTEIDTCSSSTNCLNILNCAKASGCTDQTTCVNAITSNPDECGQLMTWFVAGGQAESQAALDCVTAAAATCVANADAGTTDSGAGADSGTDSGSTDAATGG